MKPKEKQSKLGPRNLVPLLPYLRASGSSESEAPCHQYAPPSQPQRLSCGAPRAYRSGSRDGAKKKKPSARQRRRRAGLPRIQSQRETTRRPGVRDPNRSYLLEAGLGDLLALADAALQELELGDEVLALDGELLGLRVRLAQHLHEAIVRAAPRGQVDLARSGRGRGRRHQRAAVVSGHGIR